MKITIKNISDRPKVLDLTKIISFKTVISSENSYSLNLREDKVISIKEYLKDNETFKVLENEKKIEIPEEKIEVVKEIESEKLESKVELEKIVKEVEEVKEETKTDSKKKSSKKKSK